MKPDEPSLDPAVLATLRASPFADHLEWLTRAVAPCVRLQARRVDDVDRGASRFGGAPDVPAGFEWPTWNGRPLSFLAQLDLAALPPAPGLPRDGWLLFFYDTQDMPWGFDPADQGCARVVHVGGPREALGRATAPDGAQAWPPCAVEGFPAWDLPDASDEQCELDLLDDEERFDAWQALGAHLRGSGGIEHHLLGYPQPIQDEMRLQCQLVTNGLYCGNSTGYEDPRAEVLAEGAKEWRLLLQLDSDEEGPGWMWGDLGRLYWWIRESDLAARRFDATWLVLQCG